jgi:hypothetical protein
MPWLCEDFCQGFLFFACMPPVKIKITDTILLVVTTGQFYPSHYIDQSAERLELRETYGVNIDKN